LKSDRLTFLPVKSFSLKEGAGLPTTSLSAAKVGDRLKEARKNIIDIEMIRRFIIYPPKQDKH
jgi:hypothetical protein